MRIDCSLAVLFLVALLTACQQEDNPPLVGSLEWDRIAVTAELGEPVMKWSVAEGDRVEAGTVLLEQDARRQDARIAAARGDLSQAEARLEELANGARIETIDAARANLAQSRAADLDDRVPGYVDCAQERDVGRCRPLHGYTVKISCSFFLATSSSL